MVVKIVAVEQASVNSNNVTQHECRYKGNLHAMQTLVLCQAAPSHERWLIKSADKPHKQRTVSKLAVSWSTYSKFTELYMLQHVGMTVLSLNKQYAMCHCPILTFRRSQGSKQTDSKAPVHVGALYVVHGHDTA